MPAPSVVAIVAALGIGAIATVLIKLNQLLRSADPLPP